MATPPRIAMPGGKVRLGAVVAVVLAVAFVLWLVLSGDDEPSSRSTAVQEQTNATTPLSQEGLTSVATAQGREVYWVGPASGMGYEFTVTPAGRAFVRYLPEGVRTGDRRPNFLTVATYPLRHPVAAVRRASKRKGTQTVRLPNGGIAIQNTKKPTSAFYARPGWKAQVEVYDPTPGEALKRVLAGDVQSIR